MRQLFIGFLVIAAIVVGGSLIANTAYQAGLSTAVTTVAATAPDGTVVIPVTPGGFPVFGPGAGPWGPGWGAGFSIWGFLGTLFAIFLIVALIRVIAFGGRGRHRGWGPGGPGGLGGPGGPGGWGPARSTFDSWHRASHGAAAPLGSLLAR